MLDSAFFTQPPAFSRYHHQLSELKRTYPFLQHTVIGRSLLSRPIYALHLGAASPCVLFAGAFHAQEWLTCSLLLRFLEEVCAALEKHTPLEEYMLHETLADRGLAIIPMVNPDGVSIALEGDASARGQAVAVRRMQQRDVRTWQANARGVDLNHNYDAGWQELHRMEQQQGIPGPGPRQYGGPFPHSEPETKAMADFLKGRRVEAAYAFHSQGEEIFSEYGAHTPPRSGILARLLAEASGYTLVQNDGLYSHGGFKDYFIDRYHRPGFTIEIGLGENPLPITDLENIYTRLRRMLVLATIL